MDRGRSQFVKQEAQCRLWNNWRLALRVAIFDWLALLFASGIIAAMIVAHPLEALLQDYSNMDTEVMSLKGMIYHLSTESATFPQSFFERDERATHNYAQTVQDLRWFMESVRLGTLLLLLGGFAIMVNVMRQNSNAVLAPFLREVIAEIDSRGFDTIAARESQRRQSVQNVIVGIGTIAGGFLGLAAFMALQLDWIYRLLFLIGGMTTGLIASGIVRYLYVIRPWARRRER